MTQRESNPYPYSDSNKRYMTADWYYKHRFGRKTARVPLDAGCTCPNIDGTRGFGGCIYCLHGSSSADGNTLAEQYKNGTATMSRKWKNPAFIPYFQSNTNTYKNLPRMRELFLQAAKFDGAVMLDIATRADCLRGEAIEILTEAAEQIPLTVELGLQTSSDTTAELINRGHTFAEFEEGYTRLKSAADEINRSFAANLCATIEPNLAGISSTPDPCLNTEPTSAKLPANLDSCANIKPNPAKISADHEPCANIEPNPAKISANLAPCANIKPSPTTPAFPPLNLHKRLTIAVHIINGLPGETASDMLTTARDVARLHPDMVKIHLLHVLDGTSLAEMYKSGTYTPMTRDDYVKTVCDQIELLPPDITLARLTGDGVSSVLLAPLWSRRKTEVVNEIDKELYRRGSYQSRFYTK